MSSASRSLLAKVLCAGGLLLGGWLSLAGFASFFVQYRAMQWPTVEGVIVRSEVVTRNDYHSVEVQYEYTIDGVTYQNDGVYLNSGIGGITVSMDSFGSSSIAKAAQIQERYAPGKTVPVHYQPENPGRAALMFETGGFVAMALFGLFVALFSFLVLKFPGLFESTRERVSHDDTPRFDHGSIVFDTEMLHDLARGASAREGADNPMIDPGSILDGSEFKIKQWNPGKRIELTRNDGGIFSRKPSYVVCFDWQSDSLTVGPEGATETIPLANIEEFRLHGRHEIRRGGGKHSVTYEAWDVWLDAIVGSRRIRIASRTGYRDPDEAFVDAMRPSASIATSLGRQLRWVVFEDHTDYRPPRNIPGLNQFVEAQANSSGQQPSAFQSPSPALQTELAGDTVSEHDQRSEKPVQSTISKPPKSKISCEQSHDRLHVRIPRSFRLPESHGLGVAVVVGGFAALITPAVLDDPEPGPRIFVAILYLVPLVCLGHIIFHWARRGEIEVTKERLTVRRRGLVFSKQQNWSVDELLTVCVVPSGKELDGLPIEELVIVSADGTSEQFFSTCSNQELAWIAHSMRRFLELPEPPAVTQSDPDKAVLEISRGLLYSGLDQMAHSVDEMTHSVDKVARSVDEIERHRQTLGRFNTESVSESSKDEIDSFLQQSPSEISEKLERLSRSEIDVVRAEFGLIDFDIWQPGVQVRYRHETLDPGVHRMSSIVSGFGYALVFLFVVPFAVPIAGVLLVIPIDLLGSRRLHFVIADLMAFGTGLIYWIITFTLLAIGWVYLKLDAAFAPREIELDWQQRRLTIRSRSGEQVYAFQEIRRIVVREVKRTGDKRHFNLFRMEAQIPGANIILLESDQSEDIAGLASQPMAVADRIRMLAEDIAIDLGVPVELAESTEDRFTAVGYPDKPHLTDIGRLWSNASGATRVKLLLLCAGILLFWFYRAVQSYLANEGV